MKIVIIIKKIFQENISSNQDKLFCSFTEWKVLNLHIKLWALLKEAKTSLWGMGLLASLFKIQYPSLTSPPILYTGNLQCSNTIECLIKVSLTEDFLLFVCGI